MLVVICAILIVTGWGIMAYFIWKFLHEVHDFHSDL